MNFVIERRTERRRLAFLECPVEQGRMLRGRKLLGIRVEIPRVAANRFLFQRIVRLRILVARNENAGVSCKSNRRRLSSKRLSILRSDPSHPSVFSFGGFSAANAKRCGLFFWGNLHRVEDGS